MKIARSVLAGVAAFALCALLSSQALVTQWLRVAYIPHPRDYMQIQQGTPYTVPVGETFVVTALGTTDGVCAGSRLSVDGVVATCMGIITSTSGVAQYRSVVEVPPGMAVSAGKTITVTADCSSLGAVAWGYTVKD